MIRITNKEFDSLHHTLSAARSIAKSNVGIGDAFEMELRLEGMIDLLNALERKDVHPIIQEARKFISDLSED